MANQPQWPKWVFIVTLLTFGTTFFKLGESLFFGGHPVREIARDGEGPDLSNLEGAEFMISARLRIVEGLAVIERDGHIYLTTGHFLGPRISTSVCTTYPDVEYEFAAADQASSGDPVLLTLGMSCEASRGGDRLKELEVPVEKILNQKPRDTEFLVFGKYTIKVKLSNISEEWPREWSLRSVRLYNDNTEIRVDGVEAYRLRGAPITMKW